MLSFLAIVVSTRDVAAAFMPIADVTPTLSNMSRHVWMLVARFYAARFLHADFGMIEEWSAWLLVAIHSYWK